MQAGPDTLKHITEFNAVSARRWWLDQARSTCWWRSSWHSGAGCCPRPGCRLHRFPAPALSMPPSWRLCAPAPSPSSLCPGHACGA